MLRQTLLQPCSTLLMSGMLKGSVAAELQKKTHSWRPPCNSRRTQKSATNQTHVFHRQMPRRYTHITLGLTPLPY